MQSAGLGIRQPLEFTFAILFSRPISINARGIPEPCHRSGSYSSSGQNQSPWELGFSIAPSQGEPQLMAPRVQHPFPPL